MKLLGNSNQTLIRHDYKRACYRAMLSEFSAEEVVEFFTEIPLIIDGRTVKGPELFKLIWSEKEKIPVYWDIATDNLIEPFLVRKGRKVDSILKKILWLNNKTTYIPNHIHRRVKRSEEGDWIKSVQVFISDPEFKEVVNWDYDFIAGPQIMIAPVMFGMPAFEEFGMIADTRPPEVVLWENSAKVAREGDLLLLDGEIYGRRITFHRFCQDNETDLSKYQVPDLNTILMERDYICPHRKRIVLYRDCVYGAPVFLNWVAHRKLNLQPKGILNSFIGDIEREEAFEDIELEKRHRLLLSYVSGNASFEYHGLDESITLNGQHFTKNVPAKILKFLLESHLSEGKSGFKISLGRKKSNFEIWLSRLIEKLKEDVLRLGWRKRGAAVFFVMNGILEFKET